MYKKRKIYTLFLSIVLGIVFISLSACGGDTGTSSADLNDDTGAVAVRVIFQDAESADNIRQTSSPSGNVCEDYLIETIRADVHNASNEVVASASYDCDIPARSGTISGVPTGSGMYIVVGGYVAGDTGYPDWEGTSQAFALSAGETKDAGTVMMIYRGENNPPPAVQRTTPANHAGDVPFNSVITATFTEDVVPDSVISTFSLIGSAAVAGTTTYDPSTRTVSFAPDTDLEENTEHTVIIIRRVEDRTGNQMIADYSWRFTTGAIPDTESPSTPTLTSVKAVSDSAIDLVWEAAIDNVGVVNYKIYRDGGGGVNEMLVTGTSQTDTNLSADTQYCYRVVARDAAEHESGQSNELCDRTLAIPPPPAPTLISPATGALLDNNCDDRSNSIEWDFDWSDVAEATKYQIYVIGPNTTIPIIDTEVTSSLYSYTDSGVITDANRLDYTWRARAGNADGWSEWSGERNFNVEPLNTDCKPTKVIWDESNNGDFSNDDTAPTDLLALSPGNNEIYGSIGRFSSSDSADAAKFTVPAGRQLSQVILSSYDDLVYYDYVPLTLFKGATVNDPVIEFILLSQSSAGTDLLQFDSMPGPQPAGTYTFKFGSIQQNAITDERSLYTITLVVQ